MADTALTPQPNSLMNPRAGAFALAFVAGLAIRLFFLPYLGVDDMDVDLGWGHTAAQIGLAHAYSGNYFPVQWSIFELVSTAAHHLGISDSDRVLSQLNYGGLFVLFRLPTLVADIGCFALLVAILRRWNRSPSWALLYWLHPYFLVMAWLGYVDVQVLFFVLLALLILSRPSTPRVWLLAGVPLGIVLLMKPQGAELVAFLVVLLAIYVVKDRALATRVRDVLLILVAPCLLFAFASVYFAIAGDHSLTFLAKTMSNTSQVQPALNAQMPNIWLPVAVALRKGTEPEYNVAPTPLLQAVAVVVTSALLIGAAFVSSRTNKSFAAAGVLSLWAMGAAIVPMTFTEAHENHFFLAAALLILVCAITRSRRLAVLLSWFLFLEAANLFLLYGFGDNHLSWAGWYVSVASHYTAGWQIAVAILSVALFIPLIIRTARAARAGLSAA